MLPMISVAICWRTFAHRKRNVHPGLRSHSEVFDVGMTGEETLNINSEVKNTKPICIYCGLQPGTTRDHVPPKGLFARPRPALITVPCCEACRIQQPLDDEYFVQMLSMRSGLRETDSSSNARDATTRALSKPTKQRSTQALLRSVTQVSMHSASGLYIGERLRYEVSNNRLCKVIERTVLGLHFKEFKARMPEDHRCKAYALDGFNGTSFAAIRDLRTLWGYATAGQRRDIGADVFTYWFREVVQGSERLSLWALVVYGGVNFVAMTARSDQLPPG